MTVNELETRIKYKELLEWQLIARREPFGEDKVELLFARLMALTVNINTDAKSRKRTASEFVTDYWPKPLADPADMLQKMVAFVRANRGTVPSEVVEHVNNTRNL